ncbi:MAG TPA: RNA methyltransferase [Candidatus Agrococcus pullicola]|uniref:RNA methyltransferase n=1 Tax=Candidatus Agrococcus pullicola TaxID=2838429 RepID=A0A9D1YSR3_9MICO|nr:RNA methyltransferase [Candidatus Agrococcus pullicola]
MLSSPRSPVVRAVARLQQRTARSETGLFLLEGPQALRDAINAEADIDQVFFTESAAQKHTDLLDVAGIAYVACSEEALGRMADTRTPQGFVATVRQFPKRLETVLEGADRIAILHEVRDPGNLGTVLRVADAAGFDAVVVTEDSVDAYNPKVVRATTGSLFHMPHAVGVSTLEAVTTAKRLGMSVLAADVSGQDLRPDDEALPRPHAWLFGNEARGLDEATLSLADRALRVPMFGRAESMNLATAAAVCLYASAFAGRS